MGNTTKPPLTCNTFDTIIDELSSFKLSINKKLSEYSLPNEREQLIIFDRYNYHSDKYSKPLKYNNVIHALINLGFKPRYLDTLLWYYAINKPDNELIKVLTDENKCQKGISNDVNVSIALNDAIKSNVGHEIIEILCKIPGCEIKNYCIRSAIDRDIPTLDLLIDNGCDVNLALREAITDTDMFMHIFNHPKVNRELIDLRYIVFDIIVANPSLVSRIMDSPHFNIDFTMIRFGYCYFISDACLVFLDNAWGIVNKINDLKSKRKMVLCGIVPVNGHLIDIINNY